MQSIPETGQSLRPDAELIRNAMEAVKHPDSPIQIRVLNIRSNGPCRFFGNTYNGFYDDLDAAVRDTSHITGRDAAGLYMSINPLDAVVRNWGLNRLDRAVKAASDEHVIGLRHLYLDIDPKRPPYTNATADENAVAMHTLVDVISYLESEGWEPPVLAGSSGSGAMALWRIDLPTSEVQPIERVVTAFSSMFSTDRLTVDIAVANPARMVRIPGTVNAKAPTPQPDRPWALATAAVGGGV